MRERIATALDELQALLGDLPAKGGIELAMLRSRITRRIDELEAQHRTYCDAPTLTLASMPVAGSA